MAGGMDFVPLDRSVMRVDTGEFHIAAEIVPAFNTQETPAAGYTRFNGHPVACINWLVRSDVHGICHV